MATINVSTQQANAFAKAYKAITNQPTSPSASTVGGALTANQLTGKDALPVMNSPILSTDNVATGQGNIPVGISSSNLGAPVASQGTSGTTQTPQTTTPQVGSPALQVPPGMSSSALAAPVKTQPTAAPQQQDAATIANNVKAGFQAVQSTAAPSDSGQARQAVSTATTSQPQAQPLPPQVNDVVSELSTQYQQEYANLLGYEASSQTFQSFYDQQRQALGIPQLEYENMNLQTVMNGTEDDVRNEIKASGGFATESQIEGIAATRNKVLMKQSANLQNLLNYKQDQLQTATAGFQSDQQRAMNFFKDSIGYTQSMLQMYQSVNQQTFDNNLKIANFNTAQARLALSEQAAGDLNDWRRFRSIQSAASAVKTIVSTEYPSGQNPLQVFNSSQQQIARVNAALPMALGPKNVSKTASDLELLDAAVKISNSGQAIRENQVSLLVGGQSIRAKFDIASQKVVGVDTILDDNQRKAIAAQAQSTYEEQYKVANQAIPNINSQLKGMGIPDAYALQNPTTYSIYDTASKVQVPQDTSTYAGYYMASDGIYYPVQQ